MIGRAAFRLCLLGAVASCVAHAPEVRANPSVPFPAKSASPPTTPPLPPASSTDEVRVVAKTGTGSDVHAIGRPAFQVIDSVGNDSFTYRSKAARVFLKDAKLVTAWDAGTGAALQRIAPRVSPSPNVYVSLAVSDNGDLLATDADNGARVFRAPFESPTATFGCYSPAAVSHNGNLLACGRSKLTIWDISKRQLVATSPSAPPGQFIRAVRFFADDQSLVWATERGVWRWSFASGSPLTTIFEAPSEITYATIAALGGVAYVQFEGSKALLVDVTTNKTRPVTASYITALSPSGKRLARGIAALDVIDVSTDKTVWSTKITPPMTHMAFGDTDDDIAYLADGRIRVAKLPAPPAALPAVSRFAGWLAPGVASIARGDSLRAYAFPTRTWSDASAFAPTPSSPPKAPRWATWIASRGLDGFVAAERNERHDTFIEKRYLTNCVPKLRVWTPKGGTKTLTMSCSNPERQDSEDPGWEIGGGLAVGVSVARATVYDARTGRKVADVPVPPAASVKPEFRAAYWQAALSPTGDWMALIWRRPIISGEGPGGPDPREDALHNAELAENAQCETGEQGCSMLYTLELLSLKGTPRRVWQSKLERPLAGSSFSVPAIPSGALAFDATGIHLLVGFSDGEVRSIPTTHPDAGRSERLFAAPIGSFASDPEGQWIEVEDRAGEQRVWKLAP